MKRSASRANLSASVTPKKYRRTNTSHADVLRNLTTNLVRSLLEHEEYLYYYDCIKNELCVLHKLGIYHDVFQKYMTITDPKIVVAIRLIYNI